MSNIKNGWFTEEDLPFAESDIRLSVKVTNVLHDVQGKYGHIQVFDTPFFGRVLAIDGIINIADRTEFIYHEMMVNLPCIQQGNPKDVLIMGGGDGGAAKHALRIATIESITQVEIDQEVIDACSNYLPQIGESSFSDPKVELIVGDGLEYVKTTSKTFDVIVLDISDPVPGGPAEHLLSEEFYREVKKCLNPDGVIVTHCGSLIFQADKAKNIVNNLKKIFGTVTMHVALIPEFELTEFGFLICHDQKKSLTEDEIHERYASLLAHESKYLSEAVYWSSKVLPPYIKNLTGVTNN